MAITKAEFRNTTGGYVGAVTYTPRGEERGIAVPPGGTVWLSEDEQLLTANGPRDPKNNPFLPQSFEVKDKNGAVIESGERPLLELVEQKRPIPGAETAAKKSSKKSRAAKGSYKQGEEVATPIAEG